MDYDHNYKYEEEIDLLKLIYFCMSKWKSIIACAIAGAVLAGAMAIFTLSNKTTEDINSAVKEIVYQQNISIISSDETVFDSFIDAFYNSGALHITVMEGESVAEDFDIKTKVVLENTNLFNIYGASEEEVQHYADKTLAAIEEYASMLHDDLKYAVVESGIFVLEENIVETVVPESSNIKEIALYAVIGAFLGGVASATVWFVVFFAGGKLYSVSDIERKFRTKVLGSVAVCDKKNPIDKWLFHKMNGLYSQFSKEEQEKIVLLNIKNELKKNEKIKKVMLVSSLGDAFSEAAQFIKTGLEESGYIVSDFVNVIGRPDVMENATEYDVAIVVENSDESNSKIVAIENDVIREYINTGLYIVMV